VPEQTDAGDVADTLPQEGVALAADRSVAAEQSQRHDRGQLHRLFLNGHLAQQFFCALHRVTRDTVFRQSSCFPESLLRHGDTSYFAVPKAPNFLLGERLRFVVADQALPQSKKPSEAHRVSLAVSTKLV